MMNRDQSSTETQSEDPTPVGSIETEWTQTKDGADNKQWWRVGATHVNATHSVLTLHKGSSEWQVTVKSVNEYGVMESSRTINRTPFGRTGAADRVKHIIEDHMETYPPQGEFDGVPQLPDPPGDWKLTSHTPNGEWIWAAGDERLAITHKEYIGGHASTSSLYTLVYESVDGERTVIDGDIAVRCLRVAERCMNAYPTANLGQKEATAALRSVNGIGPKTALDLQLLGFETPTEVTAALTSDETPHVVSEALDKRLTTGTMERLRSVING